MGKKSLIKSTSKKKSGDTDTATKKKAVDANQTAQPAQPAKAEKVKSTSASTRKKSTPSAKAASPKKTTPKKKSTPKKAPPKKATAKKKTTANAKKAASKKSAVKKGAAKTAVKKKAPAAAKKAPSKKSSAKKASAKPAATKKVPAAPKKSTPKETPAVIETTQPPVVATTLPPEKKAVVKKEAAKPPVAAPVVKKDVVKKEAAKPPAKIKTTSAPEPPAPKPEAPKPTPTTTPAPKFTQPPKRPEPSPEEKVEVSYEKPFAPTGSTAQTMNPTVKYGTIGLAFLILLVVGASTTNSKRYYIEKQPLAIEIWKGEFSPIGKEQIARISGVSLPEKNKAVYSRNDVYPMLFQYHLNHADALLENSKSPDYDAIKLLVNKAQNYAVTPALAAQANRRLTAIELHHLFYKASITAEKATIEDYKEALTLLTQAKKLKLDESQLAMVDHKIAEIKDAGALIEVEKTVKEIMTAPPVKEGAVEH